METNPNIAVSKFANHASSKTPTTAQIPATHPASLMLNLPEGKGRFRVRSMRESGSISKTWFKAFAAAMTSHEPKSV